MEVDGSQHADQTAYDARRTRYIERSGLRVLRVWNSAVLTNRDGVCDTILDACGGEAEGFDAASPLPTLSLSAARGERRGST